MSQPPQAMKFSKILNYTNQVPPFLPKMQVQCRKCRYNAEKEIINAQSLYEISTSNICSSTFNYLILHWETHPILCYPPVPYVCYLLLKEKINICNKESIMLQLLHIFILYLKQHHSQRTLNGCFKSSEMGVPETYIFN